MDLEEKTKSNERCPVRGHEGHLLLVAKQYPGGRLLECPSGIYRWLNIEGKPLSDRLRMKRPRFGWKIRAEWETLPRAVDEQRREIRRRKLLALGVPEAIVDGVLRGRVDYGKVDRLVAEKGRVTKENTRMDFDVEEEGGS